MMTRCRYSGADIQIVVRDALMEPVRKVQSATHFKVRTILQKNNLKGTVVVKKSLFLCNFSFK